MEILSEYTLPYLKYLLKLIEIEYDETDDGATYEYMRDLQELIQKIELDVQRR